MVTKYTGTHAVRQVIPDAAIPYLKNAYRGVAKGQVLDRKGNLLGALMYIREVGIGGQILASGVARRLQDGDAVKVLAGSLLDCVSIGRTDEEVTQWKISK